jgi:hypothetical protein
MSTDTGGQVAELLQAPPQEADRRANRRYKMKLSLKFRVFRGKETLVSGSGTTCNLSSGGVLFGTNCALPLGLQVELGIKWPMLLCDTVRMKLVVFGHIIRSDSNTTAVSMEKYEFRTNGAPKQPTLNQPTGS